MYDRTLFDRIKAANAEDIDGLVDIITDFGKGRNLLDSKDKELLIFAKNKTYTEARYSDKEIKVICEQLQSYAGNTIVNWKRKLFDDSLKPYSEIVDDVVEKLPSEIESKINKEKYNLQIKTMVHELINAILIGKKTDLNSKLLIDASLVQAIFGEKWDRLSFKERYEKSTEFFITPLEGSNTNILDKAIDYVSKNKLKSFGLAVSRANPVTGAASIAASYIGNGTPSITIPFVIQMGYIELKRLKNIEAIQESEPMSSNQELQTLDEAIDNLQSINWTQELENNFVEKRKIDLDESSINTFSQLFSNVPSAVAAKEASNTHLVLSNISFEELTKAKNSPDIARGFKHGVNGIDEHVELAKAKGLQKAAIGSAIFNLASTAVAQKHLQDIAEELKQIKAEIKDVKQYLDDVSSSKIESIFEYLNKIYNASNEEKFSSEVQNSLESKLSDTNESIKLFSKRIQSAYEKSTKIDHSKFFAASVYDSVKEIFLDLKAYCRLYFLSFQTYLVCNSLRYKKTGYSMHLIKQDELNLLFLAKDNIYVALAELKSKIELSKSDLRLFSREEYNNLTKEIDGYMDLIKAYEQDTLNLHAFIFPNEINPQLKNQSVSLLLEKDSQAENINAFLMLNENDDLLKRQVNHHYKYDTL